jgi:hypothetical protein
MAEAFTLAEELPVSPAGHRLTFRRYEASYRTLVDPKQRNITRVVWQLISPTRRGILARTWPPGCGRWPPPDGCGAELPL